MKRMLMVSLLMSIGATFVTPLFPLYSESYNMNSLEITILFAIYAAFLLPTLLFVGANGNRWGGILLVLLIISLIILETLPKDVVSLVQKRTKTKISLGVPRDIRSHFWSMVGLPIFTVFTIQGIVFSLIPTFVKNVIQTSNLSVSGMIIFVLLSGAALAQFIPCLSHPITRIRIGFLLLVTGSWVIVSSGLLSSLALLWTGIFLQAIGGGWTFQIALQFAGQLPEPLARSRVISVFYLCAYSGFIFPVVGVGVLTQFLNLNLSLIVLNLFVALIVVYILMYSAIFTRNYSNSITQTM